MVLSKKLVTKAEAENKELGGYISVLYKLGVCGVIRYDLKAICKFLKDNKVTFGINGRGIIWLNSLSDPLKQLFKKNMKINWTSVLKSAEVWGKRLLLVVISGLALWLIVFVTVGNPNSFGDTKKEVKAIQVKQDSIYNDIKFLTERQFVIEQNQIRFQQSIDANNQYISDYNKELIKLKKAYNEKILSIDTYNINDLDSFFANRYKQYYK